MLVAAADPVTTELRIEPGFGHPENAADAGLLARVAEWITGRVPADRGGSALP